MPKRGGGGGGGRGRKGGHKGGHRHFTSFQELEGQQEEIRKLKEKENAAGEEESGSDDGQTAASSRPQAKVQFKQQNDAESSESSEESESDEDAPAKGVQHLIQKKAHIKASDVDLEEDTKPQLSRREREILEAERSKAAYQRLHEQGLTEEAQRDLARLALIRQQREEQARKREAEKAAKAASASSTTAKPVSTGAAAASAASAKGAGPKPGRRKH